MLKGVAVMLVLLAGSAGASAQGFSVPGLGSGGGRPGTPLGNIPGLGQPETPEQKRAFCQRVGSAAARCGLTLDMTALSACLVRTLPPQDSMRVAQVSQSTRGGGLSALMSECGIGLGR
jgi:hypothetical protein